MNLNTKIIRNSDIISSKVDEELVMFDAQANIYYNLNEIASVIWNKLEDTLSVEKLCKDLTEIFDVSEKVCQKEVMVILEKMNKKRLVSIVE